MKKTNRRNSTLSTKLLSEITPQEQFRMDNKLQLAARIADLISEKGITQQKFAERLGKSQSEISKWLSGTHNFTEDTLSDIAWALKVSLKDLHDFPEIHIERVVNKYFVSAESPAEVPFENFWDFGTLWPQANVHIGVPMIINACNFYGGTTAEPIRKPPCNTVFETFKFETEAARLTIFRPSTKKTDPHKVA